MPGFGVTLVKGGDCTSAQRHGQPSYEHPDVQTFKRPTSNLAGVAIPRDHSSAGVKTRALRTPSALASEEAGAV
jgi:hypothetical protein